MQDPTSVSDSWQEIETWLAANLDSVRQSLRPGAQPADLEALKDTVDFPLPDDVIASFRLHDGQDEEAERGLLPMSQDIRWPEPAARLLSAEEVVRAWTMLKGLWEDGDFQRDDARPAPGVQKAWWHPGWIPVADDGSGSYYCIDMAPAKGGVSGQVILVWNDMPDRLLSARSWAEWLSQFATGLQDGTYGLSEDDEHEIVRLRD